MEMNEELKIETATTADKSPFTNRIVEQYNQILAETFYKTIADMKCKPKIALVWAISAQNTLQNNGGFSPNQLVF